MLPTLPQPYEGLRLLGQGAFGSVVAARHPQWGEVAVKVLHGSWVGHFVQRQHFAREFALLQALSHPGVPGALAWGECPDGRPFFAMTLLAGEAVVPESGPWPLSELLPFLAGLASCLDAIHALGQVHGDLKAQNLLRASDGSPRLLDFGAATPAGQSREHISGTLEYLAPEAFRLAPWAPEADWYAFGVLAHALVLGRLPFEGNPQALMLAHLGEPPPPLPEAWREAQPALGEALRGLLEKDPAIRARHLPGLRQALGLPPQPAHGRLKAEAWWPQKEAEAAWAEALSASGPNAFRLEGPPQSGKSSLLARWGEAAALSGRRVLGQSSPLGPKPWAQLLRWGAEASGFSFSPQLTLALQGDLHPDWAQLDPKAQGEALLRAALEAWGGILARLGPVAVLWDAHEGQDALSQAWRAQAIAMHPASACLWASSDAEAPGQVLPLAPWGQEAIENYVAARLGQAAPPGLVEALQAHPWPGEVAEALAHFVQVGRLQAHQDGWRFQAQGAPWPGRRAQLQAALATCGGDEAHLLGLLARGAGPSPWPWNLLGQALGWPWPRLLAAAEKLLASGLVQPAGEGQLRLAHPALQSQAEALLSNDEAQPLLAKALAWWESEAPQGMALALARLAQGAGDRAKAAHWSLEAFAQALAQLDYAGAQGLWRQAQAWHQEAAFPEATWSEWLAWAGEWHRAMGKREEAEATYLEAVALLQAQPLRPLRPQGRFGLGKVLQLRGAYPEAQAQFEAAEAEAIALEAWALAARAAAALARLHLFGGQGKSQGLEAATRGVAHGRHPGAGPGLAAALTMLGVLVGADGARHAEACAHLEEALALCEAGQDVLGRGAALENLANVHLGAGRLKEAEATFASYQALCLANGNANEAIGADMNLSMVRADLGHIQEARRLAADLVPRAQGQKRAFPQAVATCTLGTCAFLEGDWEEAKRLFDEALALLAPIGNPYAEAHVRCERMRFFSHADRQAFENEWPEAWAVNEATASEEGMAKLKLMAWEAASRWGQPPAEVAPEWQAWAEGGHLKLAWWAHLALVGRAKAKGLPPDALSLARLRAIAESWASPWHAEAAWVAACVAQSLPQGPPPQGLNPLALGRLSPDALPEGPARQAMLAWWRDWPQHQEALVRHAGWHPDWAPLAIEEASLSLGEAPSEDLWAWHWESAAHLNAMAEEGSLMGELLRLVGGRMGADRGYLLAFQDGQLHATSAFGLDLEAEFERGHSRSIADEALFGGRHVYTLNARQDARWQHAASVAALDLRMVFAAPITAPEELLGVLYLERDRSDSPLTHEGIQAVLSLIAQAAHRVAWLRAQQAFELERQAAACRAALLTAFWQAPAPEAQCQALLRTALGLIPAERAFLFAPQQDVDTPVAQLLPRGLEGQSAAAWSRSALARGLDEGGGQLHWEGLGDADWVPGQSVAAMGLKCIWTWCCPQGSFALLLDAQQLPHGRPEQGLASLAQALHGLRYHPGKGFDLVGT